jgi:hypothetical protein
MAIVPSRHTLKAVAYSRQLFLCPICLERGWGPGVDCEDIEQCGVRAAAAGAVLAANLLRRPPPAAGPDAHYSHGTAEALAAALANREVVPTPAETNAA